MASLIPEIVEAVGPSIVSGIVGAGSAKLFSGIERGTSSMEQKRGPKRRRTSAPAVILPRGHMLLRHIGSGVRRGYGFRTRAEAKVFDTEISTTITGGGNWTGTEVTCTNRIANGSATSYTESCLVPTGSGTAGDAVLGTKYHLKGIRVRGYVQPPREVDSGDVQYSGLAMVYLVLDRQPLGAQAQGEDVMRSIGTSSAVIYSFPRVDGKSRFKILAKKSIVFRGGRSATDGTNTCSTVEDSVPFSFKWFPKRMYRVQISASGGVQSVSKTRNCNIFLLMNTAGIACTLQGASRCYFRD